MEALLKDALECSRESKKIAETFSERMEEKGIHAETSLVEVLRDPEITRQVISSIAGTPITRNTQHHSIDLCAAGIFTQYQSIMRRIDSEADSIKEYYTENYVSLLSYTLVHSPFRQEEGKPRLIIYARSSNWGTLARSEYDLEKDRQVSMDETEIALSEAFNGDIIIHPPYQDLFKMWKDEARRKKANVYVAYHLSEMVDGNDMILSVIEDMKYDFDSPSPTQKEKPLVILSRKDMSGWYPGEVPKKVVDELMSSYNAQKRKGLHGKTGC